MPVRLSGNIVELTDDLSASYAADISALANDRQVRDMLASDTFPHPFTMEDALAFFDRNRVIDGEMFAQDFIILCDGAPAGIIGISNVSWKHRSAHVGYWVGRKYWNHGVASDALGLLVQHCSAIGLHRLYTKVLDHNPASAKVLTKNGFHLEGIQKDSYNSGDRYHSMLLFGKILQ